ncbi:hypothetical protein NDU88_001698 [Pleurodeles waltl]|uniref:Uncharacterized protein n=1 Tax=Pleurodeles waltl TaxID=8319 RepID=A0AAV7R7V6_PLEWA|nr:hypothetical protein NDU88_001698 [Pleurodeles waltl]
MAKPERESRKEDYRIIYRDWEEVYQPHSSSEENEDDGEEINKDDIKVSVLWKHEWLPEEYRQENRKKNTVSVLWKHEWLPEEYRQENRKKATVYSRTALHRDYYLLRVISYPAIYQHRLEALVRDEISSTYCDHHIKCHV